MNISMVVLTSALLRTITNIWRLCPACFVWRISIYNNSFQTEAEDSVCISVKMATKTQLCGGREEKDVSSVVSNYLNFHDDSSKV